MMEKIGTIILCSCYSMFMYASKNKTHFIALLTTIENIIIIVMIGR